MKDLSKRTAVIVLNWNKPEMTVECLESLQTMEGEYDIFIVDNGSDQDKRDKLISEMKKRNTVVLDEKAINDFKLGDKDDQLLLLILLDKNYGYAKGNNYGLRLAHRLGYKYSLISNNDVKITDKNVLVELIKGIESDPKYAWAGPRVIRPDGKEQGPFVRVSLLVYALEGGILYPFLYNKRKLREINSINGKIKSSWPLGCFFVLKNKIGYEISFFDDTTFLYGEEAILSEKFLDNGYDFKYNPNVSILHNHSQTATSFFKSEYKKFQMAVNSDMYYFNRYRGYSKLECFFAKLSKYVFFFIYRPLIKAIKKVKKREKI